MQENHNSKYANIVLILLLLIGFVFIAGNLTPPVRIIKNFVYYAVYPNINTANQIFQSAGNFADNIKSIVYVSQENISYKQKNHELTDSLRNYELMSERYEILSRLLDMPKIKNTSSVFARVSVREPNEWYQWFIMDKGADEGLYNELPVVMFQSDGTLCAVGRISEVYKNSAKVALVTNVLSAIPVQIKGKNIDCLAEGFNSNSIKITYIPLHADVEVGDEIITSQLSSVFKEGIPVGVIRNISSQPSVDFKSATADVLFDSDVLYEAAVLVPQEEQK